MHQTSYRENCHCSAFILIVYPQSGCQSIKSILYSTEEEDDGIYDIEEVPEDIKILSSKSQLSVACAPSTTVKLSGGKNAKSNTQRQGFGKVYILQLKSVINTKTCL